MWMLRVDDRLFSLCDIASKGIRTVCKDWKNAVLCSRKVVNCLADYGTIGFFPMARKSPLWARASHYRGFAITHRHTTLGRTPLDEWSARRRDLYLTTHITHKRQTSMPLAGFEAAIPASERPQTHEVTLVKYRYSWSIRIDRTVTNVGIRVTSTDEMPVVKLYSSLKKA
jgi:hypothetical protein